MIVRILNRRTGDDKFIDCRNSCVRNIEREGITELSMIVEIKSNSVSDDSIEVVLNPGDEIYYMNDNGKTIHADYRLMDKKL